MTRKGPWPTKVKLAAYEVATNYIRAHGPRTLARLAQELNVPKWVASHGIKRAREHRLLGIVGKQADHKLIYGALQTEGWPPRSIGEEHETANPPAAV